MKALRIVLMALAFISLQSHAKDGRNLAVNQANKVVSEQRIALVIGNSKYKEKSLANPANDARDMAAMNVVQCGSPFDCAQGRLIDTLQYIG